MILPPAHRWPDTSGEWGVPKENMTRGVHGDLWLETLILTLKTSLQQMFNTMMLFSEKM